jgi:hypothetical protein
VTHWLKRLLGFAEGETHEADPGVVQMYNKPVDVRVLEHPPGEFEAQFTISGYNMFISIDDRKHASLEKAQAVCKYFAERQAKLQEPGRIHPVDVKGGVE